MEILFIKCREDDQISPDEFKLFQQLLNEFESKASFQAGIKSKDVKKVEKKAKKEIRQQQLNMLLNKKVQEYQQKLN